MVVIDGLVAVDFHKVVFGSQVTVEVFSIMKDTARRFSENETIEVTANDFDRNLATKYDFVEINGEPYLS